MWEFKCPCCEDEFITNMTEEEIKEHIGSTMDCTCGALLMIESDLTVSDFGAELQRIYRKYMHRFVDNETTPNFMENLQRHIEKLEVYRDYGLLTN